MDQTHRVICWALFSIIVVAGLKYVPAYLIEERKLDQQERLMDLKERLHLRNGGAQATSSTRLPL